MREGRILTNSKFINPLELNKRRFDLQPVKDYNLYFETRTVCEIKWIYEDFRGKKRMRMLLSQQKQMAVLVLIQ